MADTKISSLPAITTPVGTDVVAIVNGGATKKVTADDLLALVPARKNLIINGNFDIWQRGTSITNPATGVYTADRWVIESSAGGGTIPSINVKRNSANAPEGSEYVAELEITNVGVADSGRRWRVNQKVEDWKKYVGREVTLTVWLESSVTISFTAARLQIYDGIGTANVSIPSLSTTRTKFTVTRTIDASADRLQVQIALDVGSGTISNTGSIYVSQAQLELGSLATDFGQRLIGEEFMLCNRYALLMGRGLMAQARSATQVRIWGMFSPPMRVAPATFTLNSTTPTFDVPGGASHGGTGSTLTSLTSDERGFQATITGFSGLTAMQSGVINTVDLILVDAEL